MNLGGLKKKLEDTLEELRKKMEVATKLEEILSNECTLVQNLNNLEASLEKLLSYLDNEELIYTERTNKVAQEYSELELQYEQLSTRIDIKPTDNYDIILSTLSQYLDDLKEIIRKVNECMKKLQKIIDDIKDYIKEEFSKIRDTITTATEKGMLDLATKEHLFDELKSEEEKALISVDNLQGTFKEQVLDLISGIRKKVYTEIIKRLGKKKAVIWLTILQIFKESKEKQIEIKQLIGYLSSYPEINKNFTSEEIKKTINDLIEDGFIRVYVTC